MRLRRAGAGAVRRLSPFGLGTDDHDRAPQGSGPAPGLLRPLDRRRDVASAGAGNQFRPRLVSLRLPGNGKTSIAERVTRCFGTTVWIPRVIYVEGQILKLLDMANHEPVEMERSTGLLDESDFDRRWIRIKRPTIVAGGELRMDDLEIHFDPVNKVSEAPLQLKSNLGTFLIDDFGRQRMQPIELLNRWIVPLEKRYDFLSLRQRQEDPRAVRSTDHLLDEPRASSAR